MNTDGVKLEGTDLVPPAEAASRTAAAAVELPQLGEARDKVPEPEQQADPEGRWSALGLMCLSMVCCLSPWFGATAALPELKEKWSIDDTTAGVLTVMVQLGFLVGACTSAFLAIVRLHSGIASHAAQRSAPSRQRSAPRQSLPAAALSPSQRRGAGGRRTWCRRAGSSAWAGSAARRPTCCCSSRSCRSAAPACCAS